MDQSKKQSFKSKVINAVLAAIINQLFVWARKWENDAFFFIVIGDKYCSDVAWYNTENLACNGSFAVTSSPQSAGAFQDLATSCDILMETQLKNEVFRTIFENTTCAKDNNGWYSDECEPDDETEDVNNENKKGGAQ